MNIIVRKPVAHIYDWMIHGDRIVGRTLAHPNQAEFKAPFQITSPVIRWDLANDLAETHNTLYILGRKHRELTDRNRISPTGVLLHQLW